MKTPSEALLEILEPEELATVATIGLYLYMARSPKEIKASLMEHNGFSKEGSRAAIMLIGKVIEEIKAVHTKDLDAQDSEDLKAELEALGFPNIQEKPGEDTPI